MSEDVSSLREQLRQLNERQGRGDIDAAQYQRDKAELERRIVDAVMQAPTAASNSTQAAGAASGAGAGAAPTTGQPARPAGRGLMVGLAAGVVALAALGYFWTGSPAAIGMSGPGPVMGGSGTAGESGADGAGGGAAGTPEGSPHAITAEQIQAMIDKLAARLQEQPEDPDGWSMLARSYAVTQRHAEAAKAFERAYALRKDDPVLLADYADTLAMAQGRRLEGKPMELVAEALRLDPANLKALSLAGTAAFNAKDYAGAVRYWEQLRAAAPADNVFVRQVADGIEQARELMAGGGGGAAAAPAEAAAPGAAAATPQAAPPAAAGGASVRGTVSLAPALAKDAAPDDTVFIFARPADGGGMPLAILRKQVKDLPLDFTLDDSLSMSPAARLSGVKQVMVSARVSRSGNAMPLPGDLQGAVGPVEVGATGIALEIRERRP